MQVVCAGCTHCMYARQLSMCTLFTPCWHQTTPTSTKPRIASHLNINMLSFSTLCPKSATHRHRVVLHNASGCVGHVAFIQMASKEPSLSSASNWGQITNLFRHLCLNHAGRQNRSLIPHKEYFQGGRMADSNALRVLLYPNLKSLIRASSNLVVNTLSVQVG